MRAAAVMLALMLAVPAAAEEVACDSEFSLQKQTLLGKAERKGLKKSYFRENPHKHLAQSYKGEVEPGLAYYLDRDFYFVDHPPAFDLVQQIMDRLLSCGWRGPRPNIDVVFESTESGIAVIDSANVMRVRASILRKFRNEDELAAMVAHELAHVLLKHNSGFKAFIRDIPQLLDIGGVIQFVAEWDEEQGDMANVTIEYDGLKNLLGSQFTSAVWSDLLSPMWSRKFETNADKLAGELLLAAGYPLTGMEYFLTKVVAEEEALAAKRMELFHKAAKYLVDQKLAAVAAGNVDNELEATGLQAAHGLSHKLVDTLFNRVIESKKDHPSPSERNDAVKAYLFDHYEDVVLMNLDHDSQPIGSLTLPAGDYFQAEADAYAGARALKAGRLAEANSLSARAVLSAAFPDPRVRFNRFEVRLAQKRPETALRNLEIAHEGYALAPVMSYLHGADVAMDSDDHEKARLLLEQGVERVGRRYRFLPFMIRNAKAREDIETAEKLVAECRQRETAKKFTDFLRSPLSFGANPEDSLVGLCIAELGYDPAAQTETEGQEGNALGNTLNNLFKRS